MALLTCPDCGRQVSDVAPVCPGCGRPGYPPAAAPSQVVTSSEQVLFQDPTVTVTTARAIVSGNVTYAMSNVTSVREFVEPRPGILMVAGLVLVLGGGAFARADIADSASAGWIATGVGVLLLIAFSRTKLKYWVRIGTAGAETNAIWSHDPLWTRKVVAAINQAIVTRG